MRRTPTYGYNEKIFMKGHLQNLDLQKNVLSNMDSSSLVVMLTSTAIAVEWEGLLVDSALNDFKLGSSPEVRYNLAIFQDV